MSGLTTSLLTMKSQIKSVDSVDSRVRELARNMTGLSSDLATTTAAITKLQPEVSLIAADVSSVRGGITRMSRSVAALADPPRFSCGVTGDEVRVSGVISYDECAVNTDNMMNTGTGHATVNTEGEYSLLSSSFPVCDCIFRYRLLWTHLWIIKIDTVASLQSLKNIKIFCRKMALIF